MLVLYVHADASDTEASQLPSTDIPAILVRGKHKRIALPDFQLIRVTDKHICEGSLCEPVDTILSLLLSVSHPTLISSSQQVAYRGANAAGKAGEQRCCEKCSAVAIGPVGVSSA